MAKIGRPGLSREKRVELWERWKSGQCASDIARALARTKGAIHHVLAFNGGIAPVARRRCPVALVLDEREEISRGIAAGRSIRRIAAHLGHSPSTVSREVARHGGRSYRAIEADARAWERALRPKPCRLASHPELRGRVAEKLALDWSPEQISGWLKRAFPADEGLRMSHETLYRSLFVQARGVLRKELIGHLRAGRHMRYPKGGTTPSRLPGQIIDAISIRERPAEIEDRAVPGHWEGDLLSGANNSHMATLVERHSRFAMLIKVRGKDTASVVSALSKQVRQLPLQLRRSLTWDRGKEMANHKNFTIATDVQVYFCDPRSPWQRGSNENTNGLLRQYFPKGMDLSGYSQSYLNKIALRLNQRPRKTLGFETPADKLRAVLQ
jgi:IS30 family transposase